MDRPKRQTATATPAKPGGLPLTLENDEFVQWLRGAGHDGVVTLENGAINYAVFEPTQVKSALGNKGTFNPKSPLIGDAFALDDFNPSEPRKTDGEWTSGGGAAAPFGKEAAPRHLHPRSSRRATPTYSSRLRATRSSPDRSASTPSKRSTTAPTGRFLASRRRTPWRVESPIRASPPPGRSLGPRAMFPRHRNLLQIPIRCAPVVSISAAPPCMQARSSASMAASNSAPLALGDVARRYREPPISAGSKHPKASRIATRCSRLTVASIRSRTDRTLANVGVGPLMARLPCVQKAARRSVSDVRRESHDHGILYVSPRFGQMRPYFRTGVLGAASMQAPLDP